MVTPLCTVVVWQPPANPNGVIQGNDIKFSSGGAITLSASLNFHVTPYLTDYSSHTSQTIDFHWCMHV